MIKPISCLLILLILIVAQGCTRDDVPTTINEQPAPTAEPKLTPSNQQGKVTISSPVSLYRVVELPYSQYTLPSLRNEVLYVPVNENSEFVNSIISIDLKTLEQDLLFKSTFEQSTINDLRANENWITWVDSAADGSFAKTYARNMDSGVQKVITTHTDPNFLKIDSPYLYDDVLAWININSARDTNPKVVVYNLKNEKISTISEVHQYGLYNNFLHIHNGKVLWTDSIDGKGYYKIYDLDSHQLDSYEAPLKFPGYAQLMDDDIYSINFIDDHDWTSQTFGYYDTKSHVFKSLENKYINRLVSSDTHVAWTNSDQELILLDARSGKKLNFSKLINHTIDSIECMSDGKTFIAGYSTNHSSVLYIIDPLKA
ncbi:hypothetical protein H7B90_17990 [Cohnella xylanilytica]|uniref:Uncharacterized protein n=1 Tax=Cohnella xylanilytica TaxID=557555 RepID=A0A841U0G3_9BACL|nr:hypothetical protein [Cohnella xylanilytica]MBB6693299.1 hypothetical protein [Cohnella xylanilytica]